MEKLLLLVALASGAMAVHKGRAALAAVDDAKRFPPTAIGAGVR